MAHSDENKPFSRFDNYVKTGDDFMKIELFRFAKENYKLALNIHPSNLDVLQKLANCERALKSEIIKIAIAVPSLLICILLLFFLLK